ncbi:helix-turn-helix domain-containing protein [Conchiformibius kuhniae]|uniref:Putative Fis-like DNA-binding protein n=1 Tax=Conchiformibius kuhniae TaxID=211502 RepID=A0A8T9MU79_9NEIS|nr:helix-turn-helix domain-containing protein [Conchiformibius kuhniae]UOP04801.1 Fis family transcriptional regulator [Conchiformibius kuhniae]
MSVMPKIADCVEHNLQRYFHDLNGELPSNVYEMVLWQVEGAMLGCVLRQCRGNQSQAARILGLNRNTLRKKLLAHGLAE